MLVDRIVNGGSEIQIQTPKPVISQPLFAEMNRRYSRHIEGSQYMCAINVCVHMCIHSRKEGGREQRRLFHEVIWSTPAFGQVGQSEFFGSFLVITCRNAYLRQKRWAGGLGWPAGGEPRIDLGRSILVPGTPRPRYSHVSLTISFHQIPLPSNESSFV